MYFEVPTFGDHVIVIANVPFKTNTTSGVCITKRNWKSYTADDLIDHVSRNNFDTLNEICNDIGVQELTLGDYIGPKIIIKKIIVFGQIIGSGQINSFM